MSDVTCAFCGAKLKRTPRQIRECKTGLFFCNTQERGRYWSQQGMSSREQIGKHRFGKGGTQLAIKAGVV